MPHLPTIELKPYFRTHQDIADEFSGRLHWPEFFGNDHPVELDVGCGRGLFLFHAGETRPETNFLGLELEYREARRGALRIAKRGWPNVRVIGGDAFEVLKKMIAPHSVQAVHVYFPDPWWKRKHRSRRVFNDRFVDLCSTILKYGGELHSWTDVEEYFGVISGLMNHHADFETLPVAPDRTPTDDQDYQTSYDRKKRKLGLPIYRGLWRRRDAANVAE